MHLKHAVAVCLFSVGAVFSASAGLGVPALYAQTINGALVGVVRDSTGAVIPNADVRAVNEGTGIAYPGKTNASGEYRINNLPNGSYDLEATMSGFQAYTVKNIGVGANNVQTQDVALNVIGAKYDS